MHARTDLQQVAPQQADRQSNGRHHFEINQRTQPYFSDAFDIPRRCDAMHNGEKHQWRNGGLDQFEKNVAENLEFGSQLWSDKAKGDTQQHGGYYLKRQVSVERFLAV